MKEFVEIYSYVLLNNIDKLSGNYLWLNFVKKDSLLKDDVVCNL